MTVNARLEFDLPDATSGQHCVGQVPRKSTSILAR